MVREEKAATTTLRCPPLHVFGIIDWSIGHHFSHCSLQGPSQATVIVSRSHWWTLTVWPRLATHNYTGLETTELRPSCLSQSTTRRARPTCGPVQTWNGNFAGHRCQDTHQTERSPSIFSCQTHSVPPSIQSHFQNRQIMQGRRYWASSFFWLGSTHHASTQEWWFYALDRWLQADC